MTAAQPDSTGTASWVHGDSDTSQASADTRKETGAQSPTDSSIVHAIIGGVAHCNDDIAPDSGRGSLQQQTSPSKSTKDDIQAVAKWLTHHNTGAPATETAAMIAATDVAHAVEM